jgi:cobalamin biosynthesis Mg chelatase CobN
MIALIMRLLRRLAPWIPGKEEDLNRASVRTTVAITRYRNASEALQEEIRSNNFSRYLIYDKGE